MKKILKYLFLIAMNLCLQQVTIKAQINLVENGSFEQYYSCPPGLNSVDSCIGWHKFGGIIGLTGSPDYFDSCSTFFQNSVPDNIFGTQVPFEGSAYMGLYTFEYSYWYREYIGAALLDTIIPGNNYNISMRISRGNVTPFADPCIASNKMGIRLTTSGYAYGSLIPVNNFAQVYEDSIITDTVNWVLLSWNFTSDSAYTHIYIGNFFESDSTDTLRINCTIGRAYYYIDSVNIVCTSPNCFTALNEMKSSAQLIYYNATEEAIYVEGLTEKPCLLTLFSETGQEVFRRKINNNEKINVSGLSNGFYMAVLQSANKTTYKKIIRF